MLARLLMVIPLMTASCIITNPSEFIPERPLTPPRIRDAQGTTQPRLGNVVELRETDTEVRFYIPVDDEGTSDPLQWLFFINVDRDCDPNGANGCEPQQSGEIGADGNVRRYVEYRFRESRFVTGCNRVELWVSSNFRRDGDRHTPARLGDVDSTTWWVFKAARAGTPPVDPIETCAQRVAP